MTVHMYIQLIFLKIISPNFQTSSLMWLKAIFSFRFRKVWARDACGLLDLHTAGFEKSKQKTNENREDKKPFFCVSNLLIVKILRFSCYHPLEFQRKNSTTTTSFSSYLLS